MPARVSAFALTSPELPGFRVCTCNLGLIGFQGLYLQALSKQLIDDYITDVLLRDLVGHDRRPVSFLVYLWLAVEQARRGAAVQISYQELAENIGVSKSSVQAAVSWLRRRKLLSTTKENTNRRGTAGCAPSWQELNKKGAGLCLIFSAVAGVAPCSLSQPHSQL
jgi:hypothetical protein